MKLIPKTLILAATVALTGCDSCSGSKDGSDTKNQGQSTSAPGDLGKSKETVVAKNKIDYVFRSIIIVMLL